MPEKPDHLIGTLSTLWDELVPKLADAGLLSGVDGMSVELALRHYVAAMAASEQLAEAEGVAIFDAKNERYQKHPADAVFRAQSEMFLKYAGQLGLTFVSRARTPAAKAGDDGEGNPFQPPVGAAQS